MTLHLSQFSLKDSFNGLRKTMATALLASFWPTI